MNKQGKTSGGMVIGGILLVLIFGLLGYMAFKGDISGKPSCGDSTGILTVNSFSALAQNTNITPTLKVGVNGGGVTIPATSGTTTFAVGDKLTIFASIGDYLDTVIENVEMKCGGITVENPMYYSTSDNPAIRMKNDDGQYVTDSITGATGTTGYNQTDLTAGETLRMDIEFAGTSLESSGEGVYVIEFPAGSDANISKVELSGAVATTKPTVHSTLTAGGGVYTFVVPAVVGAEKSIHTLTVELKASKDLSGGVYSDWYAKQYAINDNSQPIFGVEDSDGTGIYENALDFDFWIMNSGTA